MSTGDAALKVSSKASGFGRMWRSAWLQLPVQLLGLAGAAIALDRIALATASGAVQLPGRTQFETEFIDQGWWLASVVLCLPLWFFGRRWWRLVPCLLATAAVTAPQFWAFGVMLDRYAESGFSDGLEAMGIFFPIALGFCFLITVWIGALTSPRAPRVIESAPTQPKRRP